MEREELDLIHVVWGEDQGIISLRQGRWLFYTWGRLAGYHANDGIPTVGMEDADFRLLGDDPDDPEDNLEHSNWEYVVELLGHKDFPLSQRIRENCRCQSDPAMMARQGDQFVCPTCGRTEQIKEEVHGQS